MAFYRKKPVVIEAIQWFQNGDHPKDDCRMVVPVPGDGEPYKSEGRIVRRFRRPDVPGDAACISSACQSTMHDHGWIDTPEGGHTVCPGDWIITGVKGERYPCKPRLFEATYEVVLLPLAIDHLWDGHIRTDCPVCKALDGNQAARG